MTTPKKSTGRPRVSIDWQLVGKYAESGASGNGIAAVIGINEATLRTRCVVDNKIGLSEFLQQKRAKGDEYLRDKQYEVAMGGNVPMLIWVGKNRLGQADKQEVSTDPRISDLKSKIQARATEKGVTYEHELALWNEKYSDNVAPEIKTQLVSEIVQ